MSTPHPTHARLLVVDDLEVNRELLARRVRRLGHEAGFAADGHEALAQLARADWDLVLLDITMPGMDGYETLRRIRADAALREVPVIMVSAIDDTDSVVRCLELGADDYVTKPFNPVILQARIESALARKRLADEKRRTLQALARELEIGRQIQGGFLPSSLPGTPGWDFAALCTPARQVGGDLYDMVPLRDGRIGFVIADVCDKGVGAALYMALFRTLFRALLSQWPAGTPAAEGLAAAVGFINNYIAGEHGRDNMFATLFAGVLQPATGGLHVLNAGHDAPVLRRLDGTLVRLAPGGPAVGMMADVRHDVHPLQLAPGELLLAFTDGVTEARGSSGALGDASLLALARNWTGSAQGLVDAIAADVATHVGDHEPHDDLTLLCLARQA